MTNKNKKNNVRKKPKTWKEKYEKIKAKYGAGGNGDVSLIKEKATGKDLVLKELRETKNKEKKGRFEEEIEIMHKNYKTIDGIMPIFDYSKEEYWYVMPRAELLIEYIKYNQISFDERIDIIQGFAEILRNLHEKKIYHRDIKPKNLYILNDKYYFGDFGLADFPDSNNNFTRSDKGLGAVFTIAPEMKRDPKHADGKKADVYSFAKTMWMILTLDENGFDGQYNRTDETMALARYEGYDKLHLKELEDIITISTSNNPEQRPDMNRFLELLQNFKKIKSDYDAAQMSDWRFLSKQIFGENEPSSCSWDEVDKIVSILNIIGKNPAYDHMFFSSKGGQNFDRAKRANEKGCIEIYAGSESPNIVKPKKLIYEGFGEDYTWNYFMLELDELPAQDPGRWGDLEYEMLVEDYPAHYVSSDYAQYGVYDYDSGEKYPEGWQYVRRYKRGKFLITFNRGLYNAINATYDGRHSMCSSDEFKLYIKRMIEEEHQLEKLGKNVNNGLNSLFRNNPFEKNSSVIEIDTEKMQDGQKYIEENYHLWVFDVKENDKPSDCKMRFRILFDKQGGSYSFADILEIEKKRDIILSVEGKFVTDLKSNDTLWIYERSEAIKIRDKIYDAIKHYCNLNGYDFPKYNPYLNIDFEQCGKPNHLFSCQELLAKLNEADDRYNNTVVVNENGEVAVISDDLERFLYPVRNETFDAGNIYVGKYADVESVSEDLYPDLLGRWRDYLKTGKKQYIDYGIYTNSDLEEIKMEIKKFM